MPGILWLCRHHWLQSEVSTIVTPPPPSFPPPPPPPRPQPYVPAGKGKRRRAEGEIHYFIRVRERDTKACGIKVTGQGRMGKRSTGHLSIGLERPSPLPAARDATELLTPFFQTCPRSLGGRELVLSDVGLPLVSLRSVSAPMLALFRRSRCHGKWKPVAPSPASSRSPPVGSSGRRN